MSRSDSFSRFSSGGYPADMLDGVRNKERRISRGEMNPMALLRAESEARGLSREASTRVRFGAGLADDATPRSVRNGKVWERQSTLAHEEDLSEAMLSNRYTVSAIFNHARQHNHKRNVDVEGFLQERRELAKQQLSPKQRFVRGIKTTVFISDIAALLSALDRKRVANGLVALQRMCMCGPNMIALLRHRELEIPLVQLLALDAVKDRKIVVNALQLLALLVAYQGASLVGVPGLMEHLQVIVRSEDALTKLCCCNLICSFFADPVDQVEAMELAPLVRMLLSLLHTDNEVALRMFYTTIEQLTFHAEHSCRLCIAEPRLVTMLVDRVIAGKQELKVIALAAVRNIASNAHVYGPVMFSVSQAARGDVPSHVAGMYECAHLSDEGELESESSELAPPFFTAYTNMDKAQHLMFKELTMEVLWYLGTAKARGPKPKERSTRTHGLECHPVSSRDIFRRNLTARGSAVRLSMASSGM